MRNSRRYLLYTERERGVGEQYAGLRTSDFVSRNGWRRYFPERRSARSERCYVYVTVYTHIRRPEMLPRRGGREGAREEAYHVQSATRETCRSEKASEACTGGAGILGKVRRGIWGKRGFRGEGKGRTEDSEAGSRSMEVTWPAKPSGLSNFRLDTSRGLAATSLPRVARTPLSCVRSSTFLRLSPRPSPPASAFFFLLRIRLIRRHCNSQPARERCRISPLPIPFAADVNTAG